MPRFIFVTGSPRSGTTWLLMLLTTSKACKWIRPSSLGIGLPDIAIESNIFCRKPAISNADIFIALNSIQHDGKVLVDKSPAHVFCVGRIRSVLKDVKIVCLQRNIYDTLWSMIAYNPGFPRKQKNLHEALRDYKVFHAAVFSNLASSSFDHMVVYEDLWANPLHVTHRLFDDLGLPTDSITEIVEQCSFGKNLPAHHARCFRQGYPGQGVYGFTADEKRRIIEYLNR